MRTATFLVLFFLCYFCPLGSKAATNASQEENPSTFDMPPGKVLINESDLSFLTNDSDNGEEHSPTQGCSNKVDSIFQTLLHQLRGKPDLSVSIDLFIYSINDWKLFIHPYTKNSGFLFDILKSYPRRIRILTDRKQSTEEWESLVLNTLHECFPGLEIRTLGVIDPTGRNRQSMHTKTAIIRIGKETHLIMGSYNWTNASRTKNYENCMHVKTAGPGGLSYIIKKAQGQFNTLWSKAEPYSIRATAASQAAVPPLQPTSTSSTTSPAYALPPTTESLASSDLPFSDQEPSASSPPTPPSQERKRKVSLKISLPPPSASPSGLQSAPPFTSSSSHFAFAQPRLGTPHLTQLRPASMAPHHAWDGTYPRYSGQVSSPQQNVPPPLPAPSLDNEPVPPASPSDSPRQDSDPEDL